MKSKSLQKVVFITGTPGVGKSTVASLLQKKLPAYLISINELASEKRLFKGEEPDKGYKIVDIPALCNELTSKISNKEGIILVDGHLSHYCPISDLVIVLRLNPDFLAERLKKRGYNSLKIQENLEAEALGVCLMESYELHPEKVQEIDTSKLSSEEVADELIKIINDEICYPPGKVDYLHWMVKK
ncbi:MAG: adenylate kinase family protein [Euryarchaeota archaeon]|nr:adenylate kinase family protein [Euryarchaeota archaeon]MBV1730310.1 adenylate kinase family protein [Methanobacterium sp.]MBU4547688.1 adenylate kinase family protein [Euryarchaeota archaeon]MBU4607267.1 adenylate kinase family protein [Euryarchaeota archaeon]MBV1754386.1 adenylate kinase family protein [Methanobacterium sp.]